MREAVAQWLERYNDQAVSVTNAVNFEVMRQLRLRTAFAFDKHFLIAGFGSSSTSTARYGFRMTSARVGSVSESEPEPACAFAECGGSRGCDGDACFAPGLSEFDRFFPRWPGSWHRALHSCVPSAILDFTDAGCVA